MELYKVDRSVVTVVLCTFYGAPARVRQKYAELWVGKGFSVVTISRGVPSANSPVVVPESNAEQESKARAVLDTLIANGLDQNQLVFHVMSEGGMSSWLLLMDLITKRSNYRHFKERIVGYVLDSCPYHFSFISSIRAIYSRLPFFQKMGNILLFSISILLKRLLAILPFATKIWPTLTFATWRAYRETLYVRHMGTLAQLYVWSTRDSICSPNYIADFVSRRQAAVGPGIIDTLTVTDVPHVEILRGHNAEYSNKVDAFIARLPSSATSPQSKL